MVKTTINQSNLEASQWLANQNWKLSESFPSLLNRILPKFNAIESSQLKVDIAFKLGRGCEQYYRRLTNQQLNQSKQMKKFIYVPADSTTNNVGGFDMGEITAWDYTPVGNQKFSFKEPSKDSSLEVIINEKTTLYFFGNVADNLLYQIENYLQQK